MMQPILVWFDRDLRLHDHPALVAAVRTGAPVVPFYLWSPEEEAPWSPGAASRWWLGRSLEDLAENLHGRGSRLVVRSGPAVVELLKLARATRAGAVYWNQRTEPASQRRDQEVSSALRGAGILVKILPPDLLYAPDVIATQSGRPFHVFTPFWRACQAAGEPATPLPAPARMTLPASIRPAGLGKNPATRTSSHPVGWHPGESGAHRHLKHILEKLEHYPEYRDLPARAGTSRLSPHLHFGEISIREVWHAVRRHQARHGGSAWLQGGEQFLRQLMWREFGGHLLAHFPQTPLKPLHPEFAHLAWQPGGEPLERWQQGRTGYPWIDAGMRELLATGWMHNRVRMSVASFLTKDLLVAWQSGAKWFWERLVDADLANNTLGWQWSAGCGADAQPFFRIFNPILQGWKFDAEGKYIRHWVPELTHLPVRWLHAPWTAPESVRADAKVKLGKTYPYPIINHEAARQRALNEFRKIKSKKTTIKKK